MNGRDDLPDVGTVIAPVLLATPVEQQPLLPCPKEDTE